MTGDQRTNFCSSGEERSIGWEGIEKQKREKDVRN